MLQVIVLMVGKTKTSFIREGLDFYAKRLRPYLKLDLVAVREEKPQPGMTPELIKQREADRLLARLPHPAQVVALEAEGRAMTSEALAAWLGRREQETGPVVFVLGGHLGLAPAVLAAAPERLSLSRFTFTHELARLVLLEQLYRAATIKAGHPYHL